MEYIFKINERNCQGSEYLSDNYEIKKKLISNLY